jgi:hypothetical protein
MYCASARVERLEAVRPKIEVADIVHRFSDEPDYLRRYRDATGVDLRLCPVCGVIMNRYKLVQDNIDFCLSSSRAPPEAA